MVSATRFKISSQVINPRYEAIRTLEVYLLGAKFSLASQTKAVPKNRMLSGSNRKVKREEDRENC